MKCIHVCTYVHLCIIGCNTIATCWEELCFGFQEHCPEILDVWVVL